MSNTKTSVGFKLDKGPLFHFQKFFDCGSCRSSSSNRNSSCGISRYNCYINSRGSNSTNMSRNRVKLVEIVDVEIIEVEVVVVEVVVVAVVSNSSSSSCDNSRSSK